MAFISNKERAKRIRQSNKSYWLRKLFLSITVGFLVALVVFATISIVNIYKVIDQYKDVEIPTIVFIKHICDAPLSFFAYKDLGNDVIELGISGYGIFMIIWTILTIGMAVLSLVFVLVMKSPKDAKKNINVLQGAALSGKKIDSGDNATEIYRERGGQVKKTKK